ncbi:MAG: YfhO family protein [Mogibacterium sp.]|nr:YfhO family protein [Mogibacterium sp.]
MESIRSRRKENLIMVLQYTLLFCILVLGVFGVLILSHRSFIQGGDGYKQGYFWTVELKKQMENLAAGGGITLWSWSKGLGMDVQTNYILDPFNWIAASFPAGYIELGYTLSVILKMYCGGLAFLAFMRYAGAGVFESLFGSISYVFAGYFIVIGLIHADAMFSIFMFPLLILGVERIYKGRSPVVFVLSVAYYLIRFLYYAYMAGVAVFVYILIRYFAYHKFEIKTYLKSLGGFIVWGMTGIFIAGFQLLVDVPALFGASSESATDSISLLFDKSYYIELGREITGTGNTTAYHIAGLTLIAIMLIASALPEISRKRTDIMMTILGFIAMLLPAACSFLNGMGYPTLRWMFIFVFFASWTAAEQIGSARLHKWSGLALNTIALLVMSAWTIGFYAAGKLDMGRRAVLFISIQLLGGAIFLLILIIRHKAAFFRRADKALILALCVAVLTGSWGVAFLDSRGSFVRNNAINKALEGSTQRAGAMIDDDGFYRIDQVDSILYSHVVKSPPNESMWWKTKPLYVYSSRLPEKMLEFNRLLGNNYGYSKRVFMLSNDNRAGLDYLCGVKYFLGDDKKNDRTGSDEYAGYGFEFYKDIDGVNVFKNKHDVSLGYVYDKYITESDFRQLDRLEREQALLQAAVLADDENAGGLERLELSDVETAVNDVPYEITATDGAVVEDGKIVTDKDDASFTISIGDVENSQLVVSFDGLLRGPNEKQSKSFVIHARNEFVNEMADNKINNQAIPFIRDYDLNMGYYDSYTNGRIKITLSNKGTYHYESLRVRAMDASLFDKYESNLSAGKLNVESCADEEVKGSISCSKPGVLFLSIYDYHNWKIYIDGKRADRIDGLNIAFTGVRVPAGEHSIRLEFVNRNLRAGLVLTVIGVIFLVVALVVRKRHRPQSEK